MVAINKVLAVAAVSTAVFASPVAHARGAVAIAARDVASPIGGELYVRGSNPFLDVSTLLAEVGDFVGNALDDVLHLDLNNLGDSVNTLVSQLLESLNTLLPGLTSFQPQTGTAYAIQNQYVGSALGNIVSGVGELVSKLLQSITGTDLVQTLAADLRKLVSTLDKLVTNLADNLVGYSSLTKNLGGIIGELNSALDIGPISTRI
ncbi:hypothetical protein TRVA0_050S00122 [Trichomonascus vanleenenianus]|uniref:uncharacterized protein n=1 Tax=Trichomonascus vanleenenianus TaxID=2268995 RepID=UPI003ECB0354